MPLSDITDLGNKIMADFAAGKYASLSRDVGNGFNLVGDLLQSFFGFQGTPPTDDTKAAAKFTADCQQFVATQKSKTFAPADVGGLDPSRILGAIEALFAAFTTIWTLFHPKTP